MKKVINAQKVLVLGLTIGFTFGIMLTGCKNNLTENLETSNSTYVLDSSQQVEELLQIHEDAKNALYLKLLDSQNSGLCNSEFFTTSSEYLARNAQTEVLSEDEEDLIVEKFSDEEIAEINELLEIYLSKMKEIARVRIFDVNNMPSGVIETDEEVIIGDRVYSKLNPESLEEITRLSNLYYNDKSNSRAAYLNISVGTMSTCRWSNGIIKYGFDKFPSTYKSQIQQCMNEWEIASDKKISFKNAGDFNWWKRVKWTLHFYRVLRIRDESLSKNTLGKTSPGTIGNPFMTFDMTQLSSKSDKIKKQTFRHELGHSIGLQHEFDRPDRNSYVVWNPNRSDTWSSISVNDFGRYLISRYGKFDYNSVMNYEGFYCKKNADGSAGDLITLNDIENISEGDANAVKFLYSFY